MNRNNLLQFCRTCLSCLPGISSYNILREPNLRQLMLLLTSLDIHQEQNEENEAYPYPKSLCQLCYDKLLEFQVFRNLALKSTEVLYSLVNEVEENVVNEKVAIRGEEYPKSIGKATYDDDLNDDDQLLLPELAPMLLEKSIIKSEPIDIDESEPQSLLCEDYKPKFKSEDIEEYDGTAVKNEIDSEYEEDETNFYEENALGHNGDSIGDDADDEEQTLRNGAANRWNSALVPSAAISAKFDYRKAPRRKRDRNKKSLKCPRCEKQVYKQVYLDAHIRGVHEGHEKPFLCIDCHKSFTRYNQLHVHVQSHHLRHRLIPMHACPYNGCDTTFKMRTTLETHLKVTHLSDDTSFHNIGLQEIIEMHQSQLSQEIELEHLCPQCTKKFSSKRALSEHLKRHLQIKEHVCKVCGVAKVTRTELQTHMRTHNRNLEKFKCNLCPQEFNHKNAISRHVRVVHEGLRRFPCSFCPKRFGTRNSQMCHERLHTGEKPFSCELCVKSFTQLEGLKSHMKNHDKTLRKYVCSFCSLRFITRKNLIDHEERHRGDKPHICNKCSRGFFAREDLLTHQLSHVEESMGVGGGSTDGGGQDDGEGTMEYGSSHSSN